METTGNMAAFYVQKHASAGKAIYFHTGDNIYFMQLHWISIKESLHDTSFTFFWRYNISCCVLSSGLIMAPILRCFQGVLDSLQLSQLSWDRGEMFTSVHKKEQNEGAKFQAAEFGSRMTQTQFATRLMFCFCYINLALLAVKRPGKTICDCRTFWTQPAKTQTTEPSE